MPLGHSQFAEISFFIAVAVRAETTNRPNHATLRPFIELKSPHSRPYRLL